MKRRVANTDLKIAPFVLGGNVFGWTADEQESFNILDRFVDEGFNMIDTADVYSYWAPGNQGGESETIIGNWLNKTGKRGDVLIATKVGAIRPGDKAKLNADYIRKQIESSLKRLKTDYVDLYYTHYDDLDTPIEEVLETYTALIKEGKVRYIATSNMSANRIKDSLKVSKAKGWPSYKVLQPEYNLFDRKQYETGYQALVEKEDLAVMPYYSLASGFLTGKYKTVDDIKQSSRFSTLSRYVNQRGETILKSLLQVAHDYNATPAQIALAWLMANPTITAPIASVSKVEQMDILQAVQLELSQEAVDKLNRASAY
ncbi:MAG: aldo/keto reductase [Bacteroides sp.]|nr:aldo/keto reductase [Bacteroides sp.]MDD4055558.1 aldo/keto reductase [Bacteroides sp.]MDD4720515.1 aldo/keto reductase [Bacteroides sp.]